MSLDVAAADQQHQHDDDRRNDVSTAATTTLSQGIEADSSSLPAARITSSRGSLGHRRGLYGSGRGKKSAGRMNPDDVVARLNGWDERHHDVGYKENELKPKGIRAYFSRPQSLSDLKQELKGKKHSSAMLARLDRDATPRELKTPNTADTMPALFPTRYALAGDMLDRDGQERPWNNRFQTGFFDTNYQCHPHDRQYFARSSTFEGTKCMAWRRITETEYGTGIWRDAYSKKQPLFGPTGT
jgi:hypothetical protein